MKIIGVVICALLLAACAQPGQSDAPQNAKSSSKAGGAHQEFEEGSAVLPLAAEAAGEPTVATAAKESLSVEPAEPLSDAPVSDTPSAKTPPIERSPESAQLPDLKALPGLVFEIALEQDRPYKIGEGIAVELRFSSTLANTYILDAASYDRSGRLHCDSFYVSPATGYVDPLEDYFLHGIGGLGGLTTMPPLGEDPYVLVRDLNEHVRFDEPGEYTLIVDAARIKTEGEGEGLYGQVVRSNSLTITIEAASASWQSQELKDALAIYDNPNSTEEERISAARRVRFLGTQEAAQAMVARLTERWPQSEFIFGLYASPHRALVIELLQAHLVDPHAIVGSFVVDSLAKFSALRDFGEPNGPYPSEPEARQAWQARELEYRELFMQARLKYAADLLDALPDKEVLPRVQAAASLFEMGESLKTIESPPDLSAFALAKAHLINDFGSLPAAQQYRLLQYYWAGLKDPKLKQVLTELGERPSAEQPQLAPVAAQRLQELNAD